MTTEPDSRPKQFAPDWSPPTEGEEALPDEDTLLLEPNDSTIFLAAKALNEGLLVAFPTETVFGLGALVSRDSAVQGIFKAKGRPADHPLIAHVAKTVASRRGLEPWAVVDDRAALLIETFWPGPLTLVLPKGPKMPFSVTGGQDSVGVRCPSHPVAQALLSQVKAPVAAPSANRFGKVSPTRAAHVMAELQGRIHIVLDGDIPEIGIESTIVSLIGPEVVLLRPGAITPEQIEAVLNLPVTRPAKAGPQDSSLVTDAGLVLPRVSGSLEKHYSPDAKVKLLSSTELAALAHVPHFTLIVGWTPEFTDLAQALDLPADSSLQLLPNEPREVARRLYELLRKADEDGYQHLVVEAPANGSEWEGIADRLQRASA